MGRSNDGMLVNLLDRIFGVSRLVEQGNVRGRTRTGYVLLRVHDDVRYALALLGPEADRDTVRQLRRAQKTIERRLGYIPLPMEGVGPRFDAAGHLGNAASLCGEYLTNSPIHPEGRIRRRVAVAHESVASSSAERVSL